MSTLRCVGWPSSSTFSEPRRLPMVPSSITVQSSLATFWPDAAAEGRDALAVEIGFQAVAHGFVQQDAGPAGTEHHGRLAGRCFHGVEHGDGLAGGFGGEMLGRLLVQEEAQFHASAAAGMAALRCAAIAAGERGNAEARQRLAVERQYAFAGGHHHLAQTVGIGGLHLENLRSVGAGRPVGALHQFHAVAEGSLGGSGEDRVEIVQGALAEIELVHLAGAGGDAGGHARGFADLLGGEIAAVRVARAFSGDHSNAHADRDALRGAFHHRLVDADGAGGHVLEVQVGIISALRKRIRQVIFKVLPGDLEPLGEDGLGKPHAPILACEGNWAALLGCPMARAGHQKVMQGGAGDWPALGRHAHGAASGELRLLGKPI